MSGSIIGYNSVAFSLEDNTLSDGSTVVPAFKKYKKITRLHKLNDNDESILFDADSTYIYNLELDRTYSLPLDNWKLVRENENKIFSVCPKTITCLIID